ncbi:MAG: hypothetical protein ACXVFQ_18375 [Solirubrobacteraceae bacterium]
MLSTIRARLTYANVMMTVLAFFVLGGGVVWADSAAPASRAQGFTKVIKRVGHGTGSATAKCPTGTWMVGGGGVVRNNQALAASYPSPFTSPKAGQWNAIAVKDSDEVTAWVVCAS